MKKMAAIILALCLVMVGAYLVIPGFTTINTVYIADYSLSEDKAQMTIDVGVASSVGYTRKVVANKMDTVLSLDFYSAFGGINGSIGAKNRFTLDLDEDIDAIAVKNGNNYYKVLLEKDASGNWVRNQRKFEVSSN